MSSINRIKKVNLWNAGFCELWNFSQANSSQQAREEACALVSGACYGKEIANPEKHFERLLTENGGRASEVLSFIPARTNFAGYTFNIDKINSLYRFSYIENDIALTNLRTLINYNGLTRLFSTNHKQFLVFRIKIPWMIVDHMRRHGMLNHSFAENWQSNRRKHKIEYFENDEVKIKECLCGECYNPVIYGSENKQARTELLNKGEFGLRYVTGWIGGWMNDKMTFQNMFNVRSAKNTQKECQELIIKMRKLTNEYLELA